MDFSLRYREGQFSPSEAAAITGLALHLQRDWRSQGLLKAREGGRASFTPRELAEMRLMVKLRALGLPLPESRKAAEDAAPGVMFSALANHLEKAVTVDGPADVVDDYLRSLKQATDERYLRVLADLPETAELYHYAVIESGKCFLLPTVGEDVMEDDSEVAGLINLWAVARAIVEAAPRPLITLVVPKNFR